MPLQLTGSYSSRVTKSKKPSFRRSTSSTFDALPRRKSSSSIPKAKPSTPVEDVPDDPFEERLEDLGTLAALSVDESLRDVPQFMDYTRRRMFSDVPAERSGMNSARISEVLNFRLNLPPIVTITHLHALSGSPTVTDREIAELIRKGILRKIAIPNRGMGGAAVGEGLVRISDWTNIVDKHAGLEDEVKEQYKTLMRKEPTAASTSSALLTTAQVSALSNNGFFTAPSANIHKADVFLRPDSTSIGTLASISGAGSKAAAGSVGAAGGSNAYLNSGGSTGGGAFKGAKGGQLNFSLPNTGPFLRLLVQAREHLLSLLKKSFKYREAPIDLLRERWDGGISSDDSAARAKRARGEFHGILPGRTKKWKQFYGLRFEWVLEECMGAGLVECFKTGSGTGVGVRLR